MISRTESRILHYLVITDHFTFPEVVSHFKWRSDDGADNVGTLLSFLERLHNSGDGDLGVLLEVEFY